MAEAVLLALTKIGNVLADEIAKDLLAKLSEKVNNLKDLDEKIEQMRKQLTTMNNVIRQIGTTYLTDEVVKGWIGEVRKVAYRVEDAMDYQIADEVVKIEKEIKQVIELKDQWLQPSQLVSNPITKMERQRSQDSFPELVKDEDLVGIEDNRRLLTEWLYTEELDSKVITVSGMGGLGKTTLVTNVYEREKINFSAHSWMVVSQTYTVAALLRKLLSKVGCKEPPLSMDVYDLKEEIKRRLRVLNMSYHDLSGDPRNCFLYCSLFPEDCLLSRESLVRLWIAEGFVLSKDNNTPEAVAEGNLMELICRNMLQVENDELGRVKTCAMHDIMRDLALSVAKEEKFGSANDFSAMKEIDKDVRRLSSYQWKAQTSTSSHSRTVEKVSSLHTLDMQHTRIEKLPREITKIKKLRHLLADRYADENQSEFRYFIGMQAPKDLSNLKELDS
uniref:NB-ARC domain-containing protein n=1 Tax=Leersia perrieri TaxID=77586 RepID=A0A0D9XQH2_9ORYZ